MTSAWVLIIASVVHFGLRRCCFLSPEQLPAVPDTILARHIAYCAMLHFLYDQELLPARYRRKMGRLTGFLVELVLGVAFMELLALWLWVRVENVVHRLLHFALRRYGGLTLDLYHHLEGSFMRGIMTSLAALLWLNAYAATDPTEPVKVAPSPAKASFKLRRRHLARRKEQPARRTRKQEKVSQEQKQEQKQKQKQEQKQGQEQEQKKPDPELPVPKEAKLAALPEEDEPQRLTAVASTSDC